MAHILFAVFGSAGDVFPSIAVASGLQAAGHRATVLAPPTVALYARAAGLGTATIGTGAEASVLTDDAIFNLRFDGFGSWRRTCTGYLGPMLRDHHARTLEVVRSLAPDLVVVHPLASFGSLVADELGVPWISLHLYPQLAAEHRPGRSSFGGLAAREIRRIEASAGLPESDQPLLDRGWSPRANLSVHDPALVRRSRLATMRIGEPCGFPYWDEIPMMPADEGAVDEALAAPGPLLVATLGSFIGHTQPDFWARLAQDLRTAGWHGLLAGVPAADRERWREETDGAVWCTGFVPLSRVAPAADVVLHHGGIGTTYATLLAGRPSIVVPHAFDQAFNARLLGDAGVAVVAARDAAFGELLVDSSTPERRAAAEALRAELVEPAAAVARLRDEVLACLAHA